MVINVGTRDLGIKTRSKTQSKGLTVINILVTQIIQMIQSWCHR